MLSKFNLQDQPKTLTDLGVPCHILWLSQNKSKYAKEKLDQILQEYINYRKDWQSRYAESFTFPHYGFDQLPTGPRYGPSRTFQDDLQEDMAAYIIHDRFKNFKISPALEKLSNDKKAHLVYKIFQLGRYIKQDRKSLQIWLECVENLKAKYLESTCLSLIDPVEIKYPNSDGNYYNFRFNIAMDAMIEQTQKDIQFHERIE